MMISGDEKIDLFKEMKAFEPFEAMKFSQFVEKVQNAEYKGGSKGFITAKLLRDEMIDWDELDQTYSLLYKFVNSVLFKDMKKNHTSG